MTGNEYQKFAMRTSNPKLTTDYHLLNGALGMVGESGEIADLIKKHWMQGHPLDLGHIARELGDVLWYVAETATALGYDLDSIMVVNIEKLLQRYPDGFSSERSQHRKEGDV